MTNLIKGVIVPILTPINKDESVNYDDLIKLVNHVIDGGVNAIFSMGTTGEFARFNHKTRNEVTATIIKKTNGRVPVFAGVSDSGTRQVIENIRHAEDAGANAVVATLPYFFPNTSDFEAYTFFEKIATATNLPVILYNIPAAVGAEIPLTVIDRLYEIENISAIKDSSGDPSYLKELLTRYHNDKKEFSVVVGSENLNYLGLMKGADGMVPSLANPFPKLLSSVYESVLSNNQEKLKYFCDIVDEMNQLNNFSDSWMSPNIWRKVALFQMGITNYSYFTSPHTPVDDKVYEQIKEVITRYKSLFKDNNNLM